MCIQSNRIVCSTNKSKAINSHRLKLVDNVKFRKRPKKCLYKFDLMMTIWNNCQNMCVCLCFFLRFNFITQFVLIHRSLFCCMSFQKMAFWQDNIDAIAKKRFHSNENVNINAAKVNIIWNAITSQRNWVQAAFRSRLWRVLNVKAIQMASAAPRRVHDEQWKKRKKKEKRYTTKLFAILVKTLIRLFMWNRRIFYQF